MKMYIKGIIQRRETLLTAVLVSVLSVACCFCLFHGKLNKVCGQLETYDSADYSIVYLLNYGSRLENECIYTDMDIAFYKDSHKKERIVGSGIMKQEGVPCNLAYLSPVEKLNFGEICVTRNIADRYNLVVGDIVFSESSYSPDLIELQVKEIAGTEFDYSNPNIDNNVGVVFLGFDETYFANTKCRFILFAEDSKADELSAFPQILNRVINKSENGEKVAGQATAALVIEVLFVLIAVILSHIAFFSKSHGLLYRCFLKGMSRAALNTVPFLEKILLCMVPMSVTSFLLCMALSDCGVKHLYISVPVIIGSLYCVITLCADAFGKRKRGR